MTKITAIRAQCPEGFCVWGGCDELAVPVLSQAMVRSGLDGDFDTAANLQIRFMPIIQALFSQVSPIPVKAAMGLLGYDCGACRLPLTNLSRENYEKLKKLLSAG